MEIIEIEKRVASLLDSPLVENQILGCSLGMSVLGLRVVDITYYVLNSNKGWVQPSESYLFDWQKLFLGLKMKFYYDYNSEKIIFRFGGMRIESDGMDSPFISQYFLNGILANIAALIEEPYIEPYES